MIDKNYKRVNKCLCQNFEGLSEKLEKLGYRRRGKPGASGIIVYPETNEYEELPYSEIEWKEGWMDWFDEPEGFLLSASEEYYDLKFRPGIDRFSVVSYYWTDVYYSEDPKDWEEDLKEHLNPEWLDRDYIADTMMNPPYKDYIGFGLECNSLEELEILSKYFWDNWFTCQFRDISRSIDIQDSRVWFTPSPDGPVPDNPESYYYKGDLTLYLCDIKCSDYPRLREALLGLWRIGFLFRYTNGYYY